VLIGIHNSQFIIHNYWHERENSVLAVTLPPNKVKQEHKAMREPSFPSTLSRKGGGSLRAEPSIGEAESKATNKISWANKATVHKHDKHSKFSDKRAGNSQRNERGAQTSDKRSSFGARRIARDI